MGPAGITTANAALKRNGNAPLEYTVDGNNVQVILRKPEIDGIYAANDEMALGALEATIAEPPFFLGKSAVFNALDVLAGKTLEKDVILESNLVTTDNVNTIVTKE